MPERKISPLRVSGVLYTVWTKISSFEKITVSTIPTVCSSKKLLSDIQRSCRFAYHVPSTSFFTWATYGCHKSTLMSPLVVHFSVKVLFQDDLKEDKLPLNWVTKIRSIKDTEVGRGGRMEDDSSPVHYYDGCRVNILDIQRLGHK